MKKVLIVSYSFPPLNNIAARRFGDLSKYLKENGWEAHVITTNSKGNLEVPIHSNQIYRVSKHPQASIKINNNIDTNTNNLKSILLNLKRKVGMNSRLIDRTYLTWFKEIKKINIDVLKEQNFDIIIATFGPGSTLFAGNYLSKKLKVPWIADFRDLGALYKDNNFKKNRLFGYLDLLIEKKILNKAIAISTVSEGLKNELSLYYNKPIKVIYNGWERNQQFICTENNSNKPYVYYAGRFYEHQIKSMYILLKSLKHTNLSLKIRSLGPTYLDNKIIKFAQDNELLDKIELLPPADLFIIEKESNLSELNLVIEDLDETYAWKRGTLTGKLLPLLVKSPRIIAVARKDSNIGDILLETGKGTLCSSETQIAEYLTTYNSKEEKINQEMIDFYSKKNQAKVLSMILNQLIQK